MAGILYVFSSNNQKQAISIIAVHDASMQPEWSVLKWCAWRRVDTGVGSAAVTDDSTRRSQSLIMRPPTICRRRARRPACWEDDREQTALHTNAAGSAADRNDDD